MSGQTFAEIKNGAKEEAYAFFQWFINKDGSGVWLKRYINDLGGKK